MFDETTVPAPSFTGVRILDSFPLERIVPYIDWSPFFHAWELRGSYPAIFESGKYGEEARRLFDDGRALLEEIVQGGLLTARAIYGIFPAASKKEDVILFDDPRKTEIARFHFLRQQQAVSKDRPRLSLADMIAPEGSGVQDHLGAFVVTTGLGLDKLAARFEESQDDYQAILAKALADRLAEAFAELLHEKVRREWGHGEDPALPPEELIKGRYQGIRPVPGYPACPDHSEKRTLFALLDAEKATGVRLTENCAMTPAASVAGLYFAHLEAKYFSLGKIGRDQLEAYAKRKGVAVEEAEKWVGGVSP